jgi:hypothetical protein
MLRLPLLKTADAPWGAAAVHRGGDRRVHHQLTPRNTAQPSANHDDDTDLSVG